MAGFFLAIVLSLLLLDGCSSPLAESNTLDPVEPEQRLLTMMSISSGPNADFETDALKSFASKRGYQMRYIPVFESDDERLAIYQGLLRDHSPQPDVLEIDIIWSSLLADGLLDLKPYLGADIDAFPPELIRTFTVGGRLIAIPDFMDTGLLYYRKDLLRKYGFSRPPETWDDLEKMAQVVQSGERRAGRKNFWGYVWQGEKSEALTCNALEWQTSQGGGQILQENRTVAVDNPNAVRALQRAVNWIGTISPPGVIAYSEDDSFNVWKSGNAAFMRNWAFSYGDARQSAIRDRFGVAMLPGSTGIGSRTLGGSAVAVSRYSNHRDDAIAAVRYLTNANAQRLRALQAGSMPTRSLLQRNEAVMENTPFHGSLAGQVMTGVVARPSVLAGKSYDAVSCAYFEAVHSALVRRTTPQEAFAKLEKQLAQITGFRAVHKN